MSDPYNILYITNPIKSKYQYFQTVYSIVLQLLQRYDKLKLSIQQSPKFNYAVIQLTGFLPIKVENRTFGTPIKIHFPYDYPQTAPYVICLSGDKYEIVKNHPFVNENGFIGYIQYNWTPNSNLLDMIQYLIHQFGQKPPVRKCAPPLPPHQNQMNQSQQQTYQSQNYQSIYQQNVYQQQIMKQSQQTSQVKQLPQPPQNYVQSNPYHKQQYQTTYHQQPTYSYYNTQNHFQNQPVNQYSHYPQQQMNQYNQMQQTQYQQNPMYRSLDQSITQSYTNPNTQSHSQSLDSSYQQRMNEQLLLGKLQRDITEKKSRIQKEQEEITSLQHYIEIHKNDHKNKSPIDYFIQTIPKEEFKRISNESILQTVEEELQIIDDLMAKRIISIDNALEEIKVLASKKYDVLKQSSN